MTRRVPVLATLVVVAAVATMVALREAGGLDVVGYAMPIALAASMSMALPVSTPPNAMAHATGELTRRDFLRTAGLVGFAGSVLVLATFALIRRWLLGE